MKAFLVAFIDEKPELAANNKTAAIAGRCFGWAYRRGPLTRQACGAGSRGEKISENNGMYVWYYFTACLRPG
ncbi:hypothetical protein J2X13_004518 [Aminobacter aminovorans]|nr:hypothetical protein [Aminobacter aminovorans]